MKEVDIVSKIVNREGGTFVPSSKGTQPIDLSDYLLKSIWDKVWEIRTDSQGTEYIFGKLPVVTQYGITMYSGDGVDIPSLASGLPFDGRTIWYNPDTQQIEVIGGTGGGSGEGVSNFWDLSGIPSWITNSKPKYTYSEIEDTPDFSGYATQSWVKSQGYVSAEVLSKYIPISGYTEVSGEKNFTGGLKVNGSPIYYDTEKKYWKLEGDLLVTGGVTMYGSDSSFTPSTIMDALLYDDATLGINSNGQLYVKGGAGGGGLDITALQNYLTQNSYLNVTEGDGRYLMLSGGTINGKLTIKNSTREVLDIISTDIYGPLVKLCYYNDVALSSFGHIRKATESNLGAYWMNNESGCGIMLGSDGKTYIFTNQVVKAEHEIWHEGNFNPSNYLPLSGGTLTGNILLGGTTTNKIGTNIVDTTGGWQEFTHQNSHGYIAIGPFNDSVAHIYTDRPSFFFNKDLYVNNAKVWHSGNDGSGSGLDADLLDGIDSSLMFYARKGRITSNNVNTTLANGVYYTAAYTPISGVYSYGTFINFRSNAVGVNSRQTQFYIPDGGQSEQTNFGARIYFRDSWNSTDSIATSWHEIITDSRIKDYNAGSATKLQTARTIWGQSFDGTGNVSGALSDVTGITFKNDYYGLVIDEFGNFSFKKPSSTAAVDWSFKDSSGNKLMIINNSGNVGIGTANPLHKLHIYSVVNQPLCIEQKFSSNFAEGITAHNSSLSSGQHYSLCVGYSDTTKNRGVLSYYHYGESSDNNRFCLGLHDVDDVVNVLGNGNVGIGTTSPTSKLEVSGIVKANYYDVNTTRQTSLTNSYTLGCGMYGSSIQHSVSDGYTLPALMWSAKSPNGNSSQFSIMSYHPSGATGYLIIGVAKNGTRTAFIEIQGDGVIQAGGNFLASGGITMYSDQRKKTILNHVELSLKQIADAPLIEHYYNSDEKKTTHVGSIAQYWASMNDWFCKLDSEGFYTMEIQNAALASAISIARELDRYETKTDKAIKKLKKRICELEEEVERLKSA